MRNTIYIFLVFVLVFFLNLLLYIYVDSYRGIVKTLKYGSNNVELSGGVIDDTYNVNSIEENKKNSLQDLDSGLLLDLDLPDKTISDTGNDNTSSGVIVSDKIKDSADVGTESVGRVAQITVVEKEFLDIFFENNYGLYKKLDKDDLLDIAGEYPDGYLQYSRDSLDVYMLTTRTYSEVESMFSVLEYEMPFKTNPLNNFGTKSFYINLDKKDDKIRFIFEYKQKVFGVKVSTLDYEKVRGILQQLK